jgi:hypothetical protein
VQGGKKDQNHRPVHERHGKRRQFRLFTATLVNIVLYRVAHVDLERWLSIAISRFIKADVEMMRECANKLLGAKANPELYRQINGMIAQKPEVRNVFYLTLLIKRTASGWLAWASMGRIQNCASGI